MAKKPKVDLLNPPKPADLFKPAPTSAPAPKPAPTPGPLVSAPDSSTAAGRFAMANIPPTLIAGERTTPQSLAMANQVRAIYEGQNQAALPQKQAQMDLELAQQQAQTNLSEQEKLGKSQEELRAGLPPAGMSIGGAEAVLAGGTAAAAGLAATGIGIPAGLAVGTAGLAAAGGVAAFAIGKATLSDRQNVNNANKLATGSRARIGQIIDRLNRDPNYSRMEADEDYAEEIRNIFVAERNLKSLTSNKLSEFISGGKDDLTKLEATIRSIPDLNAYFVQAKNTPNPLATMPQQTEVQQ
jgi:hypothetical protein